LQSLEWLAILFVLVSQDGKHIGEVTYEAAQGED